MEFATILKELRESSGITQDDFARLLQVSRSTVAGYETERRQPDYDKLVFIAEFFNVSIDYLLTGHEYQGSIPEEGSPFTEQNVDRRVLAEYRTLALSSKCAVMDYIELLKLRENTKK